MSGTAEIIDLHSYKENVVEQFTNTSGKIIFLTITPAILADEIMGRESQFFDTVPSAVVVQLFTEINKINIYPPKQANMSSEIFQRQNSLPYLSENCMARN